MNKEYKHPHLKVPEGGNGAYCPMEPEKKDVWEVEFDSHWEKIMPKDRVSAIVGSQVKNFIRQDFIPRAEVVEMVKGMPPMTRTECEDGNPIDKDDLLDLLTQEK